MKFTNGPDRRVSYYTRDGIEKLRAQANEMSASHDPGPARPARPARPATKSIATGNRGAKASSSRPTASIGELATRYWKGKKSSTAKERT